MKSRDLLVMRRMTVWRRLALCLALFMVWHKSPAGQLPTMQALEDDDLSQVSGQDGLAFNLVGFQLNGPLTLTYTSSDTGNPSLSLSNFWLSRSDDTTATFTDPYTLNIYSRTGLSDVIALNNPLNASGLLQWQFAADLAVQADGTTFDFGALILRNLAFYGGGLTITTPADPTVQGVSFGLALRVDIGNLMLRPQGRDDITVADASTIPNQLSISGIHLSSASDTTKPWVLADVTYQPGIFNAVTDSNGQSYLHVGIDWSSSTSGAPVGKIVVDDITFKSTDPTTGAVSYTSLGSSRINTFQIQYLDVKFR